MIDLCLTIYLYGIIPSFFVFTVIAFIWYEVSEVSFCKLICAPFIWPIVVSVFVCICIADALKGRRQK
jgi:hypothetical protein